MAISYAPFDAGAGADVTEATWRSMARHWVQTGVLDDERSEFAVSESSPAAMTVDVAAGTAWIRGHWVDSDATESKAIGAADASNARIDRVVLRADFTANTITIEVLEGTAAASPTAPALTQNTTRWEISLAQIAVAAGATSIVNANITDERTIVPSNAAYEAKVDRTGATAGEVPTLQGDGTLAFASSASDAPIFLGAPSLHAQTGSATLGAVGIGRWSAWLMDSATAEQVSGGFDVPSGWSTVNVDFYWTNAGTGSGDVRWQVFLDNAADAGDLAVTGSGGSVTATAPAQNILKITRISTGQAVTPANLYQVRPYRDAANAADTLGNDVGLIGVLISKAS